MCESLQCLNSGRNFSTLIPDEPNHSVNIASIMAGKLSLNVTLD